MQAGEEQTRMAQRTYPSASTDEELTETGSGDPMPEVQQKKPRQRITVVGFFTAILLLAIIVSGAILFMALVGMIKYKDKETKDQWIEICSQILNAIFTFNAIVSHPGRLRDLIRFFRVNKVTKVQPQFEEPLFSTLKSDNDFEGLVKRYSFLKLSDDAFKKIPIDTLNLEFNARWKRLLQILVLLNINCFAQYPITIVMWTFHPAEFRPSYIVYAFLPMSFLGGAVGGVYELLTNRRIARHGLIVTSNNSNV